MPPRPHRREQAPRPQPPRRGEGPSGGRGSAYPQRRAGRGLDPTMGVAATVQPAWPAASRARAARRAVASAAEALLGPVKLRLALSFRVGQRRRPSALRERLPARCERVQAPPPPALLDVPPAQPRSRGASGAVGEGAGQRWALRCRAMPRRRRQSGHSQQRQHPRRVVEKQAPPSGHEHGASGLVSRSCDSATRASMPSANQSHAITATAAARIQRRPIPGRQERRKRSP